MNKTITTKCVNGTLTAGDLVISTPDDDYSCLVGTVLRINLLGTPEHDEETENDTDDVHVDFLTFDYSEQRVKEIESMFSDLYGEEKTFEECPIDDTIMAPCNLIRITGINEDRLNRLLESELNAAFYCYNAVRELLEQEKSAEIKITAICPRCGNGTFVRREKDGEQGFECLSCEDFVLQEDLCLTMGNDKC